MMSWAIVELPVIQGNVRKRLAEFPNVFMGSRFDFVISLERGGPDLTTHALLFAPVTLQERPGGLIARSPRQKQAGRACYLLDDAPHHTRIIRAEQISMVTHDHRSEEHTSEL